MKKILLLLFVSAFSLMILGCQPPADIITDIREEYVEAGAKKVTMWTMDFEEWNNQINISQRMDFNDIKDDGIQLEQTIIDMNSFEDMIRSARESGGVPDIYMVSYGNIYKEIRSGNIVDLTSYFSESIWNDLTDNAKDGVVYDDKYYAFPILFEPSSLLFYRKDLLSKYAQTDEVPTNWQDFISLLEQVKVGISNSGDRGIYPFDVPKGVALGWATWGLQMSATNGLAISNDWSESRLNHIGYQNLAELWSTLYSNSYVPLSSGDYTEVIIDMCMDKLVMATAGSWSIATIVKEFPDLIDQIGVMEMPAFSNTENNVTATNGGWTYVISSQCQDVEAAVEVIKYLVAENTDKTLEYFQVSNYSKTSPRLSVQQLIEDELDQQELVPSEWVETVYKVSNNAILEPIYPWDISITVSSMLENAALGNNISQEISNAHQSVISIIQEQNLTENNPRG
jgi:multiple sugar transport system substrate-binding protein